MGGVGGRGKKEVLQQGTFRLCQDFLSGEDLWGPGERLLGPACTWSPGRPSVRWVLEQEGGGPAVLEVTSQTFLRCRRDRLGGVPACGWALMVLPSPKLLGNSAREKKSLGGGKVGAAACLRRGRARGGKLPPAG